MAKRKLKILLKRTKNKKIWKAFAWRENMLEIIWHFVEISLKIACLENDSGFRIRKFAYMSRNCSHIDTLLPNIEPSSIDRFRSQRRTWWRKESEADHYLLSSVDLSAKCKQRWGLPNAFVFHFPVDICALSTFPTSNIPSFVFPKFVSISFSIFQHIQPNRISLARIRRISLTETVISYSRHTIETE